MSAANGDRPLQAEEVPVGGLGWPSLVALVAEAGLPVVDLDRGDATFWLARDAEGEPVGCFGLELAGPEALLRSVVVRPGRRRGGLSAAMVDLAEAGARALGVRRLVLLTETAGPFFERLGYHPIDRAEVTEPIRRTAQFQSLCPVSATCLAKSITLK